MVTGIKIENVDGTWLAIPNEHSALTSHSLSNLIKRLQTLLQEDKIDWDMSESA